MMQNDILVVIFSILIKGDGTNEKNDENDSWWANN